MTSAGYECFLSKKAHDFFKVQSRQGQGRLDDFFLWLERHPHHEGDGWEIDERGFRVYQSICGPFVISHRTDHAVREVRVQDIVAD